MASTLPARESFARPGQLLVSRSFYEVVSCCRATTRALHHEGARTDSTCASMTFTPWSRHAGEPRSRYGDAVARRRGAGGWLARKDPLACGDRRCSPRRALPCDPRRRLGAARMLERGPQMSPTAVPAPRRRPLRSLRQRSAAREKLRASKATDLAAARPVELAVGLGEVLVDGKPRREPPLRVLEVAPPPTPSKPQSTFPRKSSGSVESGEA